MFPPVKHSTELETQKLHRQTDITTDTEQPRKSSTLAVLDGSEIAAAAAALEEEIVLPCAFAREAEQSGAARRDGQRY